MRSTAPRFTNHPMEEPVNSSPYPIGGPRALGSMAAAALVLLSGCVSTTASSSGTVSPYAGTRRIAVYAPFQSTEYQHIAEDAFTAYRSPSQDASVVAAHTIVGYATREPGDDIWRSMMVTAGVTHVLYIRATEVSATATRIGSNNPPIMDAGGGFALELYQMGVKGPVWTATVSGEGNFGTSMDQVLRAIAKKGLEQMVTDRVLPPQLASKR